MRYPGFCSMPKEKRIVLGQVLLGNWIGSPRLIDLGHVEFDEAVGSD
jgi:hypothetical protein